MSTDQIMVTETSVKHVEIYIFLKQGWVPHPSNLTPGECLFFGYLCVFDCFNVFGDT